MSKNTHFCALTVMITAFGLVVSLGCTQQEQEPEETTETTEVTPVEPPPTAPPEELAVAEPLEPEGRVIILGFDGVDPNIVSAMFENGELPNLAKLREQGTFKPLRSSNPPQSPTAWSSFATCKDPGDHGIYDFLRRNPKTMFPGVGFGQAMHAKLSPDGSVAEPAHALNFRQGDAFWTVADRQGAHCRVLSMPFAFPADPMRHGVMLSGLGVPDIRATTSTFVSMATDFTPEQLDANLAGGMRLAIEFDGDTATVMVPGARDPRQRRPVYVEAPLTITRDAGAGTLTLQLDEQEATLSEGEWSDWLEWTFEVTPEFTVRAISRFNAMEVGEDVRLYMTCLQFHPEDPYIPFTVPVNYSADLAERYGLYKTIGWAYDTHALRQDAMTEALFMEDVNNTMAWREQLTLDEMDRGDFDMLVSVWTATDRVSHMFWRYRDPDHPLYTEEGAAEYGDAVEITYRKMDDIVGAVMAKLQDNDLFMVMSDHGFHSFRRGFNVNTWLIREGYLAVEGGAGHNNQPFLQGYDWSNTQAYSLGLGSIFLNLEGRERNGIVSSADAEALRQELKEKLLAVTDPETGDKVFSAVYTRDYYEGSAMEHAPDIQLGYAEGYQSTKDAAKGAAPDVLFENNDDKWSGEHASSDVEDTPGVFFSNATVEGDPAIIDLGVLALTHLNATVPDDFEGTSLAYSF